MTNARLVAVAAAGVLLTLALPGSAAAITPTLWSVSQHDRHPVATFSAPRADLVTVWLSSSPDRATDGNFLQENIAKVDILTDSEMQSGRWLAESRVDPGTYWVMLEADADFTSCWIFELEDLDPACAEGYSNVMTLTVPKPAIRYAATVTAFRYIKRAVLQITAAPLGENVPYRVCYRTKAWRSVCVRGTLEGFSWDSSTQDLLTVNTRNLPTVTTFSWYVGATRVAIRRARLH
jgi:hypothetical protein